MTDELPLSEFDIIRQFFSDINYQVEKNGTCIELGVGDDCALLSIGADQRFALSIDTLIVDRHFPALANASDIAQRALAVSVSDLAAMGAEPFAFTLALSFPEVNLSWLKQFSQGLRESAQKYHMSLIGGDTTKGMLSISIQVHGVVPKGSSLQRSGAQIGDDIYVSGCLGDASVALAVFQNKLKVSSQQQHYLHTRFYQPEARVELGKALLGFASSAIDISDGLLADLGHIVKASSVAASINSDKIPRSEVLLSLLNDNESLLHALTGGDDYELCFTANSGHRDQIFEIASVLDIPITIVGKISAGKGVQCFGSHGQLLKFATTGYQHF